MYTLANGTVTINATLLVTPYSADLGPCPYGRCRPEYSECNTATSTCQCRKGYVLRLYGSDWICEKEERTLRKKKAARHPCLADKPFGRGVCACALRPSSGCRIRHSCAVQALGLLSLCRSEPAPSSLNFFFAKRDSASSYAQIIAPATKVHVHQSCAVNGPCSTSSHIGLRTRST
ncbi:hypothetical protein V5799_022131 [Amblyomma americanum]|uniref:Uncharacterized protein n=1 Tax=Amblyomma americanum TaxID=6943 RepID=A0AAQ4FMW2_AMBAM